MSQQPAPPSPSSPPPDGLEPSQTGDEEELPLRPPGAWRGDVVLGACLSLAYALTAATTLQGHDHAEWVSLSELGGTAHPPGYPLYSLLLRLMGLIPAGDAVLRTSLLSSVVMALGVVCLARGVEERSGSIFSARVVAIAFGLCLPTWRMGGLAEVPALLVLNAGALVWLISYIDNMEEIQPWHGAAVGALMGVGVVHHHSLALLLPWVLWAVVVGHPGTPGKRWLAVLGAAAVGGTVVVSGTWAAWLAVPAAPEAFHFSQIDSLFIWWDHLLRREYGTLSSSRMAAGWSVAATWDLLRDTFSGLHLLCLLALLSLMSRRAWPVALCWMLAGPWLLGSFTVLDDGAQPLAPLETRERFHVLPLLLTAVMAHDALASLARQMPHRKSRAYVVAMTSLLLACVAGSAFSTLPEASWKGETAVDHTLRTAVRTAPHGAVVALAGDPWIFGWNLVSRWEGRTDLAPLDWPRAFAGRRHAGEATALLQAHCPLPCLPPATAAALLGMASQRPVVLFPAVLAGTLMPAQPVAVEGLFARITSDHPSLGIQREALTSFMDHTGIPGPLIHERRFHEGVARAAWAAPWMVLMDVARRAGDEALAASAHQQAMAILSTTRAPSIDGKAPAP